MAGDKNKHGIWGPSAFFTCDSNYLSAATGSSSWVYMQKFQSVSVVIK